MLDDFPVIRTINAILPFIENKPEIARIEKDGYTVFDYLYVGENTFDNPVARECRGIKFDSKGNIIARPFHKFFNLNETDETKFENQDWSKPFVVMNKWDGSMIHPALVNGEFVFMTRKGVTDVALQAMKECEYDKDKMIDMLKDGFTPIYEYISPNNKIVIHYPEPKLIPINCRYMTTGQYLSNRQPDQFTNKKWHIDELLTSVKTASDIEGIVIQSFNPPRFIKFKADDYVALHRVLDETAHEKRVLALIMDDKLDDVLPLVTPDRAEHLKKYARIVNKELSRKAEFIIKYIEKREKLSQKDFAIEVQQMFKNKEFHGFFFKARTISHLGRHAVLAMIKEYFKKTLTTQMKVDVWRNFLGNPTFEMLVD